MAINSVTNWQNFKCYVNPTGAPSPGTATTSHTQVKGLLNVGGSPGVTASLATAAPIDQALVLKAKGSQDPGQITMSFVRDDDDPGQVKLLEAGKAASNKYAFLLTKGSGLSMNFVGLVTAAVNPGGSGTDFAMLNVTVDLTAFPT